MKKHFLTAVALSVVFVIAHASAVQSAEKVPAEKAGREGSGQEWTDPRLDEGFGRWL